MKRVHLLMPMAGGGVRFESQGYLSPKPLIEIAGKPFFYWAIRSVTKFVEVADITCVVLREHVINFHIDKAIKNYFPNANIIVLEKVLNGAVLTCLEGIKAIADDMPILINDCDHAFVSNDFSDFCKVGNFDEIAGALLTFRSSNSAYSFAETDENDNVIRTVEKQAISNRAICGAYYFGNARIFRNAAEEYLEKCEYMEYFISGVYNILIERKECVKAFWVDKHLSFGTPQEYTLAKENLKEFDEWK